MKTLIKNGRVIDPSQNIDAIMDLLVEDGVIKEVAAGLKLLPMKYMMPMGL